MSLYKGTNLIAGVVTPVTSGARNIGQVIKSFVPLTEAGLHLLDGSVISGSGSYSNFVTYMATLYSNTPELFVTESDWQQSVSDYGVCGKFVYNSVNNTVRLPSFASEQRFLIDSYKNGDTWYRIYSDGWCEQGGKITGIGSNTSYSGTFSKEFIDTHYSLNFSLQSSTGTQTNDEYGFLWVQNTDGFTAYQSNGGTWNSIWVASGYTNISTYKVTQLYEYIVVANSTKTAIEVDIDEIATDLNAKVDKSDLSEVHCVIETYHNGTAWYRIWSDGFCEQGDYTFNSGGENTAYVVTLLQPYADTDYSVAITFDRSNDSTANMWGFVHNNSASQFQVVKMGHNFWWRACGYLN